MSRHTELFRLFRYFLLALAGGFSRLPFVRPTPINWDGVQFALALGRFDLHAHQPHPPGYILYVLLGRASLFLWADPALALSMLSVLFSAAAAPLVYWLARRVLADDRASLPAALLWLGSPLALYYGSVGLTYVPEAVSGMVVAGLAWRVRSTPATALAALMGVVLGVAGGVRQTSILVLLPLCMWALWGRRSGYRIWAAFGLSFALTCASWLVPLLSLSGGPGEYLRENALLASAVSDRTSVLGAGAGGVAYNLTIEALGLGLGLCFGLVPLGLWVARVIRFSLSNMLRHFLLWWTLPALLFYGVSHVGQYGYLLVALPPLLLLSAACILVSANQLKMRLARSVSLIRVGLSTALALGSAAYFVVGGGPITASSIAANDAYASALRQSLTGMDPADTVLVTGVGWENPFRLAGYILPSYHIYADGIDPDGMLGWLFSAYGGQSTYHLPHPAAQKRLVLPSGTRHVLALDPATGERMGGGKKLKAVSLADGSTLYRLDSSGPPIQALVIEDRVISIDFSAP